MSTNTVLQQVLGANAECVKHFGDKASLALPPERGSAILTCMDARLDPAKYAGLSEGDAHIFLTVKNLEASVAEDVKRIKSHPLVNKKIPVYGYIYDLKTGKLNAVPT